MEISQTSVTGSTADRFAPPLDTVTAIRPKAPAQQRAPSTVNLLPARRALIEMLVRANYGRLAGLETYINMHEAA
jgi:hypothetical protein